MRIFNKRAPKIAYCAVGIVVFAIAAQGQTPTPTPTPPASNIYVIEVKNHQGQLKFGEPKKITTSVGYNNQPSFLANGKSLLYASIRDKQADIYRYDPGSGTTMQVTDTKESEVSPTLMPDGNSISVVRVEADGTQRLWKFPVAGGEPSLILEKIKPVGYHLWIDDHTLALFILGKPNTLQIIDTRTEKAETIAENPGRILRRIPHQDKLSFVHKISDQEWIIKAYDLDSRKTTELIKTFTGVEDYAWTPAGDLLMAKDAKLFVRKKSDWAWQEVSDFAKAGLKTITRIAVSPKGDRIAFVAR